MQLQQSQSSLQELRQEQTMTYQQIQALELLAAPVMDLQTIIRAEIERNPVLEIESEDLPLPLPGEDGTPVDNTGDDDEWVDQVLRLDEESPVSAVANSTWSMSPEDEEVRKHYLDSIATRTSFHDELAEQLRFLNLDEATQECCETIVACLNDDGYLTSHPADLAMACGASLEVIERAITVVQSCEPAGVGARDLRERMLLQLGRAGRGDTLAYRLVADHLDDLGANRMPAIARKLGVALGDIRDAMDELRHLSPHLSHEAIEAPENYVQEEAVLIEKDGRLQVNVPDGRLPRLRISGLYRQLLRDRTTPQETREYIKSKVRAAFTFISNLSQRQNTLERIVNAIVQEQQEFFRGDYDKLKPLTMAQVARGVGVHETTVSRAVSGKYLRCRYGLLPLRQFFTAGIGDGQGHTVSNKVIKDAIRDRIMEEDPAAPLSDGQISTELRQRGWSVARRTVVKYRESMGIPALSMRRRYW